MPSPIQKIKVRNPVVEMDGDEMTRVIWAEIKKRFIQPFLDVNIRYYDLGLPYRVETSDKVVFDAAAAIKKHGVGIKCATINPDKDRVKEYNLKITLPSANGIIRNFFGGTVFREPVLIPRIPPLVRTWKHPIIIGRHAFGDQYKGKDFRVPGPGTVELVYKPVDDEPTRIEVFTYQGPGVAQLQPNTDESIVAFAQTSFNLALSRGLPLFFSTKDNVMKKYDGHFRDLFQNVYEEDYEQKFIKRGLTYEHRLIDDMVAYMMKSEGGFILALKNHDGDVISDLVAQGFASLGLMTSVLTTPDGKAFESEAAHGTVTRHFREQQKGNQTSTNPIASIFAWTRGLKQRGALDDTPEVIAFAEALEKACIDTVQVDGIMTKDLAISAGERKYVMTAEYLDAVEKRIKIEFVKIGRA
ncbi:hypothetical protein MBLNU459_g3913t1 [Dothideomycetes sp. NU459]